MENRMKNYMIYISILTVILLGVFYILDSQLHLSIQTNYVIPAYFLITVATHLILRRAFSKDPKKFSINFLGGLAFKMLASFAFLTIMFVGFKGIEVDFVAVFMGVYMIYTVFEVVYLRPMAKTPKE
jgi:Na+/glutamate symporter